MSEAAPTDPQRAKSVGPLGYGMGPVAVAGGAALLLGGIVIFGGPSVAMQLISDEEEDQSPPPASSTESPGTDEDPSTGPEDPDDDPDRDSDPDDTVSDDQDSDSDSSEDPSSDETSDENREGVDEDGYLTEDVVHVVEYGETLSSISADYGVPVEILTEHNSISDVNLIYADSALLIPYSEVNVPADHLD